MDLFEEFAFSRGNNENKTVIKTMSTNVDNKQNVLDAQQNITQDDKQNITQNDKQNQTVHVNQKTTDSLEWWQTYRVPRHHQSSILHEFMFVPPVEKEDV